MKPVLTTGDVSRLLKLAPSTIAKMVDSGELRGYRLPNSRHRRIPLECFEAFVEQHGLPVDRSEVAELVK